MKKKVLLIIALLAAIAVIAVCLLHESTPAAGPSDGSSETMPKESETGEQSGSETQETDETDPDQFGAAGVEIWEDETTGQNETGSNQGGTGNQGGSQGNQGSTGSQGGSQGNTGSQGGETTPGATEPDVPTQPGEDEESGVLSPAEVSYEDYMAMTPEQQQAFYESFPSLQAYVDWYNAAKAAYEENRDGVIVDGGNLDIGDYIDKP